MVSYIPTFWDNIRWYAASTSGFPNVEYYANWLHRPSRGPLKSPTEYIDERVASKDRRSMTQRLRRPSLSLHIRALIWLMIGRCTKARPGCAYTLSFSSTFYALSISFTPRDRYMNLVPCCPSVDKRIRLWSIPMIQVHYARLAS